jgi:hypothetical protein
MTHEEAIAKAQAFIEQVRHGNAHDDEGRFQGAVLALAELLRKVAAAAAAWPAPPPTPWALFHRLWSKAVGTQSYDKEEWKRLETALLEAGFGPGKGPAQP